MPPPPRNRAERRAAPKTTTRAAGPRDGEVKYFGPTRDAAEMPVIPFATGWIRNGVVERHEFGARPQLSYGTSVQLVNPNDDGAALRAIDRALRRYLVDDDGVPANWQPEIVGRRFTDPDGNQHPIGDLPKITAFAEGSSRRRWKALMEDPEDPELELKQAEQIFAWLNEQAVDFAEEQAEQAAG